MPYKLSGKCVHKENADGSLGEQVQCFDTEEEAANYLKALYANVEDARHLVVIRTDAGEDWVLDVLGVPYGGPWDGKDSYGTFWDDETEMHEDKYGLPPIVYYHGLNPDGSPAGSPEYIGKALSRERKSDGTWFKVMLDKTSEYAKRVWEAAKKGLAAASSGTAPHLGRIADNGHVDEWPVVELSVFDVNKTQKPANPYAVVMPATRAVYEQAGLDFDPFLRDDNESASRGGIDHSGTQGQSKVVNETPPGVFDVASKLKRKGLRTMTPEQLREIIGGLVEQFASALIEKLTGAAAGGEQRAGEETPPVPPEEEKAMQAEAIRAITDKAIEAVQKDTGFKTATEATIRDLAKQVLSANQESLFEVGARAALEKVEKERKASDDAAKKAIEAAQRAAPPVSKRDDLGGHTPGSRIEVGEDLKYAHLTFEEMALGLQMIRSEYPAGQRLKAADIVSDGYLRSLAARAIKVGEEKRKDPKDEVYIRAQLRANEIDAPSNTGFGLEWVGEVWSTKLWEKARNEALFYSTMQAKGMWEQEVPQGAATVQIQTEGSDPTVYSFPGTTDVDATGRPTVSVKTSPFGTGTVEAGPGRLGVASAFDVVLEEDSVIPILPQINKQLQAKMVETIDQAMINGDEATGANTNINLIDGTPGTGLSRPYYLNNGGVLYYPLVTNTALKRDASGQFSLDDFRLTLKLLANQFREKRGNLLYLMDSDAHLTALAFPELATSDVRPTKATIESGMIRDIYGIDVLVSGFMALANSAGKIPAAGGTLGRLALVYAPYWAFAWKRQIKIEQDYDALAQTKVVVATMRFDFVVRGADASAVTYDIGIA